MAKTIHVLGIAGSLRKASFNLALLKKAQELAPGNMRLTIQTLIDIPLYNDDVIPDAIPPAVLDFRKAVSEADALLIACPEYNYSYTGVLKNALDWLSTDALGNLMNGKRVALMGASKTGFGTVRAQLHLRQVLFAMHASVLARPEVHVSRAQNSIDPDGKITDEKLIQQISSLLSKMEGFLLGVG